MTTPLEKLRPKSLSLFLVSLFSLLSPSLGLGYADVRPLVVLRGLGLEKGRLANRNMWSLSNTIFTLREGEKEKRKGSKRMKEN